MLLHQRQSPPHITVVMGIQVHQAMDQVLLMTTTIQVAMEITVQVAMGQKMDIK